jgi:L,D-transpeptidase ErfK/SrfK
LKKSPQEERAMVALLFRVLVITSFLYTANLYADSRFMGARLCRSSSEFSCYQAKRGDSWERLFPNARERDIVMRVNRIGIRLRPGVVLAIPRDLGSASVMEFSPFPSRISAPGENIVMVSLHNMAWGAYDGSGDLVRWGPASSAIGYCADEGRSCHTATGHFAIYRKGGPGCVSTKFPLGRGGAPMPYCMYFHGGFALHGSYEVPGYNASHGCVRILVGDAEWLSQDFTDMGTPVIVNP